MERTLLILGILLTIFTSCTTTKNMQQDLPAGDNSRNALDWAGVYSGVLSSDYGSGIEAMIRLNKDDRYELKWKYKGERVKEVEKTGKFSWDANGGNITLEGVEVIPSMYKVGEHKLMALDKGGNVIKGQELMKDSASILEQYWKLAEVRGKAVSVAPGEGKEPHMILKVLDSRVSGNGGCNGFGGNYTLGVGNKINFSPIISTKMACNALSVENAFFGVFESVDQYQVNGDNLVLFDVNRQELARFVTF